MTVSKIIIQRHETRRGWYKVTIISLQNPIGITKIELLIRAETLRHIRNSADRALKNKPPLNIENLFENKD